ncbi:hypothetical protein [Amycolatopsis sp. CA-230715]|uniref:hypothetical protein n=1 Tax=Amycolatopsis sp. CA-230715 TaxID=2745196 RepID=UPI001C028F3B|nr:hypothetical protein [Amycolatopsis sp. CA-230715]
MPTLIYGDSSLKDLYPEPVVAFIKASLVTAVNTWVIQLMSAWQGTLRTTPFDE